jgi:hypothetical protein
MIESDPSPSAREAARLRDIVEAAAEGRWDRFEELSDAPFPNTSSMREQFLESAAVLSKMGERRTLRTLARLSDDGTRYLFCTVVPDDASVRSVSLTVLSSTVGDGGTFETIVFVPELDLSAL